MELRETDHSLLTSLRKAKVLIFKFLGAPVEEESSSMKTMLRDLDYYLSKNYVFNELKRVIFSVNWEIGSMTEEKARQLISKSRTLLSQV